MISAHILSSIAFICSIIIFVPTQCQTNSWTFSSVAQRYVLKEETQEETVSGSFKKTKDESIRQIGHTRMERLCWTNLSLFPRGVGKIDHAERLVLSTLSLASLKARKEALRLAPQYSSSLSPFPLHLPVDPHTDAQMAVFGCKF